jgi:hypothetical protein
LQIGERKELTQLRLETALLRENVNQLSANLETAKRVAPDAQGAFNRVFSVQVVASDLPEGEGSEGILGVRHYSELAKQKHIDDVTVRCERDGAWP